MKQFVFIGICLFLFSTATQAETMYVNDIVKITLRTGPGIDHKIIAMIQSGQDLEVLESKDGWTLIRLPNGKEGWVLNHLLTSTIPNSLELHRLRKEQQKLTTEVDVHVQEIAKLKEENHTLRAERVRNNALVNKLSASYEDLKKESADILKMKSVYQKTVAQLGEQTQTAKALEKELQQKYITAGLCGAGILLLGFIIGFSAKRQRRRPSLL